MADIIVVGGGASGMVASIVAARRGMSVILLERLNRIGKKLLVTGNGRCNLSNTCIESSYYHTSSDIDFSYPLKQVDFHLTQSFFEELGIIPLIEEEKVYPFSEQASSVLDVLRMELEKCHVMTYTDTKIVDIYRTSDKWQLLSEDGRTYSASKVIFATGGMAGEGAYGCDDTGYHLLEKLGHTIVRPFPTLVHVLSKSPYCKMMKGTKIKCDTYAYTSNQLIRKEYGEVLFTEDGLSGPPIFQLSRIAAKAKQDKRACKISLDLLPHMSYEEVVSMIYSRIAAHPNRTVEELFIGWLNKRMVMPIIKYAGLGSIHIPCENLDYEDVSKLAKAIKQFEFETSGTRDYKYAQATAGGVKLEEIDFHTMASKKEQGLYLTGEVMDVDGDCGGYNLQWAWSTGYLAGLSASQ